MKKFLNWMNANRAHSAEPLEHSGKNLIAAPAGESDLLTVMSYNVKACNLGRGIREITADILAGNPAIVCVQEVDKNVRRSKKKDLLCELATSLQMNYHFYPAIHLQKGMYGIGILSVYPLESCRMIPLEVRAGDEGRVLASAVVHINGRKIKILNTHLSFENADQRKIQWDILQRVLTEQQMPYILMGDFNISDIGEFDYLKGVNCVNNTATPYETFVGDEVDGGGSRCLDNIFVSVDMTLVSGKMADTTASDHRPILAKIKI